MICPLDKEYYNIMKDRLPNEKFYTNNDYHIIETRLLFIRLINLIKECEIKMEEWRVNLESMVFFSTRETFDKIDTGRKNYMIKEDVNKLIMINYK